MADLFDENRQKFQKNVSEKKIANTVFTWFQTEVMFDRVSQNTPTQEASWILKFDRHV